MKDIEKDIEKEFGIPYNEIFNLDLDDEIELIRIHNIEKKTGIPYNKFLQLDVFTQMKFYQKFDLDFPKNKSIDDKYNEMVDNIISKSKIKKYIKTSRK